jgi:anti-anti-sigma factor
VRADRNTVAAFRGDVEVRSPATAVVVLAGEVDAAAERGLDDLLGEALARDQTRVLVDVTAVTYLGSRGAGALIRAWAVASEQGKTMHVTGANDLIRRLAAILGVEAMLEPRGVPRRRAADSH